MEQQPVPEKWSARPAASSNWSVVVAVLLVGSAILGLAYLAERRHAADLAAENKKMAATLSQTQSQLDTLTARVNTMALQASPAPLLSAPLTEPPSERTRPTVIHKATRKTGERWVEQSQPWKNSKPSLPSSRRR